MQTDKAMGEERDSAWSDALADREHERKKRQGRRIAPVVEPERRAGLIRTIEGEIVPRLLMAQRTPGASKSLPRAAGPGDVSELVRILIATGPLEAAAFVESVRRRGTPLNRICLDLLAPAARQLGSMWEEEQCSFADLSYALSGLHSLLQEVSSAGRTDRRGAARE